MKKLIVPTLLMSALSTYAYAQDRASNEVSNKVTESTECMLKVDMIYLQQLSEKQKPHERKLKKLCDAGQRNQAQAKADILTRKFMADPEVKKANACTAILGLDDDKNIHICDDL